MRAGVVAVHEPVIVTDGGPWAEHDMACAVCHENKAVLFLNTGVFWPCDRCRARGWALIRTKRFARRLRGLERRER